MKASKFLVVCPKSIILTAWKDDKDKFFPHLKVLYMTKDYTKTQYKEMAKDKGYKGKNYMEFLMDWAQIMVINPEYFKMIDSKLEKLVNGLIVDESVMMANIKSQQTKQLVEFGSKMKYVYLLSGNPAPNSNLQYHPQMQVVDPSLFSNQYYKFRNIYFYQADYMGYNYEMKPEKLQEFTDKLSKKSIVIKKKDCLDLKEPVYQERIVTLPSKAMKSYKKMERDYVTLVESGELITVQSKIASLMKLRQLSSGFIYDENHNPIHVHNAKLNETFSIIDELGHEQLIIWVNFIPEIDMLVEKLEDKGITYTTAYSKTKSISESVNMFKRGDARILIANPKTLKYGQTLVNCTYAMYFSESYSYDDYKQSRDRIYRKGQNDQVTFIFLKAKDTIDFAIHDNVTHKGNATELVERFIKDAQERI